MNNQNDPNQNENGKPRPELSWAKWVEQRSQFFAGDSEGGPEIRLEDLQSQQLDNQQLDDLQLDGQLRMLGKLSDPSDSFVDGVLAETGETSTRNFSKRRLPVVEPIGLRSEEARLEAIAREPSIVEPPQCDSLDSLPEAEHSEIRPASELKSQLLQNKLLLLLNSLAIAVAIGFFLWGLAKSDSESPLSAESKPASSSNSNDDDDAISSPTAGSLVEQSVEPPVAPDESHSDSVGSQKPRFVTHEGQLHDEGPTRERTRRRGSSDARQLPELPWGPTEKDAPQSDRQRTQLANAPVDQAADVLAGPRLEWRLTMEFDDYGIGRLTLNEEPLMAILLQDNADFVLRQVGIELTRRLRFLESRLGSAMVGSIRAGRSSDPSAPRDAGIAAIRPTTFNNIDELEDAIELALDRLKKNLNAPVAADAASIARLRTRLLVEFQSANGPTDAFMAARTQSRQLMRDNWEKVKLIDLQNRQTMFYTDDEAFTICNVLAASEVIFKDLAKKRVAWNARHGSGLKNSNQGIDSIGPKAFIEFAKNGNLNLPAAESSAARIASIQNLDAEALKKMLFKSTTSFDLFGSTNEFNVAKQFVQTYAQKSRMGLSEKALAKFIEPQTERLTKGRDIEGLPLVMGDECHATEQEAVSIRLVSRSLGRAISRFKDNLGSRDPSQSDAFRRWQIKGSLKNVVGDYDSSSTSALSGLAVTGTPINGSTIKDTSPQRLKTADQILQIDHPRLRLELIDALKKSETSEGLRLLTKRAKYDLFAEVRIAATNALASFPRADYRAELLEGLTYPWHVVAQHSAEALVRLDDQEAIPELVAMLDLPHPQAPVEVARNEFVKPELVAINHMKNCLLCHAPAGNARVATGAVPSWEEPIPQRYYASPGEASVRADITYLEQDFSVIQPVENHGHWPRDQRFDYVVQRKPMKPSKAARMSEHLQQTRNLNREAIVYALRKLTNESPEDNSSESWKAILKQRNDASPTKKSVSMR